MVAVAIGSNGVTNVYPDSNETVVKRYVAAAAISKGEAIYIDTSGEADLADASAAGTAGFRGIAIEDAVAGDIVSVLEAGTMNGFTLTGAYDSPIYLSDTAGGLDTATGTVGRVVGQVMPTAAGEDGSSTPTKVLRVATDWLTYAEGEI